MIRPVADLFCGLGGFSFGMKAAQCTPVFALDSWDKAIETYKKNFPKVDAQVGDITDPKMKKYILKNYKDKLWCVTGGPPCQSFSMKNFFTKNGSNLPMEFAKLATSLNPKVILMEEVPGVNKMLTESGETYLQKVIEILEGKGYSTQHREINVKHHGVPQSRRRLVLLAVKGKFNDRILDNLPEEEIIPLSKVIKGPYESLEKYQIENVKFHNDRAKKNGKSTPLGYRILDMKKPSPTLTTQYHNFCTHGVLKGKGKTGYSRLSIKQGLVIQSFPESTKLSGVNTTDSKLIGNAFPPRVTTKIVKALRKALENVN